VFRIRIDLNTDPDPAFEVNSDPDSDSGFFMNKIIEIFCSTFFFLFQSQIAINTFVEGFQAQVKTTKPSAKWSMLFLI